MKVQIISDIHLEMYSSNFRDFESIIKKDNECNILFMAGDIGHLEHETFKPFLDYVSSNWEEVYYVLGNHEFYQINKKQSDIIPMEKLQLLYDSIIDEYHNIMLFNDKYNLTHIWNEKENTLYFIYGNTAWTKCILNSDSKINDVNYIYTNNKDCFLDNNTNNDNIHTIENEEYIKCYDDSYINPNKLIPRKHTNKQLTHLTHLTNNKEEIININTRWMILKNNNIMYDNITWDHLNKIADKYITTYYNNINIKFIIFTHFPIAEFDKVSHPKYHNESSSIKEYFCNNILNYIHNIIIINLEHIFIAGHTHYSYNYTTDYSTYSQDNDDDKLKLKFISNQKGYNSELYNYNNKCVFSI
jgi:UDP-2,3-diacylglucosamine pyrophosphatase LpxH